MRFLRRKVTFVILSVAFVLMCAFVPYNQIMLISNGDVLTRSEFEKLTKTNGFVETKYVFAGSDEDGDLNQYNISFKLFNLFNIKNLKVNVVENNKVLVGGDCVGLSLKSNGVIIVGSNYIITKNGNISPIVDSGLKIGDVIVSLNGEKVDCLADIQKVLSNYVDGKIQVVAKRKGEQFETLIKPEFDIQTKSYKLGVWIRDDAMGVGTLTFVEPQTLRFASLGHAIADSDTGQNFDVKKGEVYKCNVVGVKKGQRGVPGEILGLFMQGKNVQGKVDKNCEFGVYGNLDKNCQLTLGKSKIEIGGKLTAKPGKATILTCVDGVNIEEFDVELIKTNYQTGTKNKSMILKITDPDLIEKTGGIVQGMSGSPILQDGKLVGAVTHVFVNDPTKGFGLYVDYMLNE